MATMLFNNSCYRLSLLAAFLFFSCVLALKLEPIPADRLNGSVHWQDKRDDTLNFTDISSLNLQDFESLLWGQNDGDGSVVANFTLYFPHDYEFVLSTERFGSMLQAVECKTNNDIALRFKDNAAFSYAVQTWDWVNRNDNYTFVLITNNDGCVTSGDRKPFVVSHLTYDASDYTINMDAQARNWTDIAHTYSLSIRHGPPIPSFRLVRRADVSLNLASDFSGNLLQESVYGVDMSVDCTNCGTSGSLRVDFDISVSWFSLDSASITIQPRSVEAFLEIQLSASGAQSTPYGWEKTLISIPIEGFDIPDIITLGGFLDVAAGYSLSKWSGNAVATMGATMKLSDSAIVEVDLVNSGNNRFSGWSPVFNVIPIEVNAKVGGNAEVFVQPAVMLAAEALGVGFDVLLDMKTPDITADFAALADTKNGVCGTNQALGVEVDSTISVDFSIQAAYAGDDASPFWKDDLFSTAWPLFSTCLGFGPSAVETGSAHKPRAAPLATITPSI